MHRLLYILKYLFLFFFFMSCNGQTKPIDKQALNLENFDFETKFSTLIPDRNKVDIGYYEVKTTTLVADTIYGDGYFTPEEPLRIEYRRIMSSTGKTLAKFGNFKFNAFNLITTIDGKMMLVNALAQNISLEETQRFIKQTNEKYGEATKTIGEFMNESYDIFTWELEDRIIKYSIVHDDESNALKFVVDEDNNTIREGEKVPHFNAYIYLIKKEYADEIMSKRGSGDLLYCK